MNWFLKFMAGQNFLLEEDKEKPKGGETITMSKEQFDEIMARLPAKADPPKDDKEKPKDKDDDLAAKAAKERTDNEKTAKHEKSLEAAISFNTAGKSFVKDNAAFLPKTIEGIFTQAEKENYGSAIEKSNAIKAGVVSEFFAVQANMDLLTGAQKIELDEFLKLTKNGKQERVENIYAMIFEPTLETIKKIERAKQVSGNKDQSDGEKALAERMMKLSKEHYLGVK
jgi:hypothetical protein